MNVTIDAVANVTVNGVAKGHVLDAVRNDPLLAADIKAAFDQAWLAQMVLARDAQAGVQAQLDALDKSHQAALNDLQAKIDALGGTELAQQMAKQKAVDDAQAALDAAAARLVEAQAAATDVKVTP